MASAIQGKEPRAFRGFRRWLLGCVVLVAGPVWAEMAVPVSLSVAYPAGEHRLSVSRNGDAFLAYAAHPKMIPLAPGTFDVQALYEQLAPHLHPNLPREQRPDPEATYGMVQVRDDQGQTSHYLIFQAESWVGPLFQKARDNVQEDVPSWWPPL